MSFTNLFMASAHAAAAPAQPQAASPWGSLVMILGFVVIFYFLIYRPQAKRNKEHRTMVDSLAEGSEIIFAGGLMGRIKKLDGDYAVVTLNPGNEVIVQKAAVISVLPAGTMNGLK